MRLTPQQSRAAIDGRLTMIHVPYRSSKKVRRTRAVGPRAEASPGGKPARAPYGPERDTQPFVPRTGATIPFAYEHATADQHTGIARGYLVITDCTTEPVKLSTVGAEDAKAAGHKSVDDFRRGWVERHDHAWVTSPARAQDGELIPQLRQRFADRHADTLVWPVRVRLATDVDEPVDLFMLPAARGDAGDGVLGYTTNPGRAIETAPIVRAELGTHWTDDATRRHREARREHNAKKLARSLGSRVREVLLAADRAGVETDEDRAVIEAALAEIEQRRQARKAA